MGQLLIENHAPHKADAVVVLGGGSGGDRILKGGELVRSGFAPLVLVSGPQGWYGLNECDAEIPFALKHGFPPAYFECLKHTATSTREEAVFLMAEMRRRGIKNYLMVTSEFHTARASRVFRSVPQALPFTTVASTTPDFDIHQWWKSRNGIKYVFLEWTKTVAYWFDF